MIILVDCDGVLCDLVGALCRKLATYGFRERTPEEFTAYTFQETLTGGEMVAVHDWMCAKDTALDLPEYDGACAFTESLRDLGGELFAVTAPWHASPTWSRDRAEWLDSHCEFPVHRVLAVPKTAKPLVRGDVFIEDSIDTAEAWAMANPAGLSIVIDRPWNRRNAANGVIRCHDYAEIVNVIRGRGSK